MKDRLPTKVLPNGAVRYGVYDDRGALLRYEYMLAADDPSEAGTPLSVATLLQDATAALFGLNAAAVPNDVLNWIGQYNTHWWSVKNSAASVAYDEVKTDITKEIGVYTDNTGIITADSTITYASSVTIDQSTGAVSLKSPTTIKPTNTSAGMTSAGQTLIGKYVKVGSDIYYVPTYATIASTNHDGYTLICYEGSDDDYGTFHIIKFGYMSSVKAQKVTSQIRNVPAGELTYVHSTNRNAYPDSGVQSGNTYNYLGIPFTKATTAPKIATGTYVGTGLAGAGNPNMLSFDFIPELLIVSRSRPTMNLANLTDSGVLIAQNGVTEYSVTKGSGTTNNSVLHITWSDKSVSFYHEDSYASGQLNSLNQTYHYFAIG